jgi:predicted Zn-dependent peptidase
MASDDAADDPAERERPVGVKARPPAEVAAEDFGPTPTVAGVPELASAEEYQLPNGLKVKLLPGMPFPSVSLGLSFRGGASAVMPGPLELLSQIERDDLFTIKENAVNLEGVNSRDLAGNVVTVGSRNLLPAVYLLAERLSDLDHLPWRSLLRRLRPQLTAVEKESPRRQAGRALWAALYGAHPYARSLPLAHLAGVSAPEMTGAMARLYHPANATLVIAGHFDPNEAKGLVRAWFQNWRGAPQGGSLDVPLVPPPPRGSPQEEVQVTWQPGATQVQLALGCRLPPGQGLRTFAGGQLLAETLGQQFNTLLREEAGVSYGVSASSEVLRQGAHHLVLRTAIDNAHFAEALRLVRQQWARFGAEGFAEGAVSQARWALFEAASLRFQTSKDLALAALEAANEDWSLADMARWPDLLNGIDRRELAAAFSVCRASTVMSLIGDVPVIQAALAKP